MRESQKGKISHGQKIATKMQRCLEKIEGLPSSDSDSTYATGRQYLGKATICDERDERGLDHLLSSNYTRKEFFSISELHKLRNEADVPTKHQLTDRSGTRALLEQFYSYLTLAHYGNKGPQSSKQHKVQVETVLHAVDKNMDLVSLTD